MYKDIKVSSVNLIAFVYEVLNHWTNDDHKTSIKKKCEISNKFDEILLQYPEFW